MSTKDPMAAVHQYIDGFNKGDAKVMAATFAVPGSILDGMARHVWQGPTATQLETCWLKVSNMAHQAISSLWASRCIATSPAIARMWLFPRP
jgi:hypothetical protein